MNKAVWMVLIVIIIGGGLYLIFGGSTEEPAIEETGTVLDVKSVEEDVAVDNETDALESPVEDAQVADSDPSGANDLGMEFPDPDSEASDEEGGETHVIDLTGFNYGYSEDEIRVRAGDTVTINFTSTEGFHDWVVDEFDAATERVNAGQSTSVTFVADEAGTYEYYCSVGNHRAQGMVGTLIVE